MRKKVDEENSLLELRGKVVGRGTEASLVVYD